MHAPLDRRRPPPPFANGPNVDVITFQVAFSGVLYVDGGLTGVGRAARIRPDLAGQRLAYHLMTNMAKIAKDKGIIRQAGTEVQKGIISRERREMKERVGEVDLLYKVSIFSI